MRAKFFSKAIALFLFAFAAVAITAQEQGQPNINPPQDQTPPSVSPQQQPPTMTPQEKTITPKTEKKAHKKAKHTSQKTKDQEPKNEPKEEGHPFVGEITATKLMVRAEPSSGDKSTVVSILHKGALIAGLKVKDGFVQIPPTEGATCWIAVSSAKKEGDMAVIKKEAHLKADARSSSPSVGIAKEGERLKILKEHGKWYKVAAPAQARLWIAKKYVNILTTASSEEDAIAKAKGGDVRMVAEKFKEAEAEYTNAEKLVDAKNFKEADYSKAIESYQFVVARTADKKMKQEAESKLQLAIKKQDILNNAKRGMMSAEQEANRILQEPPKEWAFQGYLDGVGGLWIHRPGTHKLTAGGKVVCYLKPAEGDTNMMATLKNYWGQYVGVNGEIQDSEYGKVIIVNRIQPLLQQE